MTQKLDAWLDFDLKGKLRRLYFVHKDVRVEAAAAPYPSESEEAGCYVNIGLMNPVDVVWKSSFFLEDKRTKKPVGKGCVLAPGREKPAQSKEKKRLSFLRNLRKDDEEMLAAVAHEKGLRGLHEKDLLAITGFSSRRLRDISCKLESRGHVKILRFDPLFLISQVNFDYFCGRITRYLEGLFQKNTKLRGIEPKKIGSRFGAAEIVLKLALRRLLKKRAVIRTEEGIIPAGVHIPLSAREEEILELIEDMCLKGELRSVSFEELRKNFRLSTQKLNRLLSFLAERNKIFQGKDGLVIHSRWLDEVINRVRDYGGKELTVGDFKQMTGLTRKYAIPLLELLDNIGVTRRRGAVREVL